MLARLRREVRQPVPLTCRWWTMVISLTLSRLLGFFPFKARWEVIPNIMAFQCALDTQRFYDCVTKPKTFFGNSLDFSQGTWIPMVNGQTKRSQFFKNRNSMVDSKTDGQHFLPHLFQKSPEKNVQGRTVHFMAKSLIDSEK